MLTRYLRRATFVIGAIVAAVLFFLGGAALRLLMGPISLGPFATVIEDALNHSVSGVVIRFDGAVLEWSRAEGRVNLIVLGTKVFDLNGHIVAQAPKADLDFDAASILAGHPHLKRFGLLGVQLTGVRSQDGVIHLGFGREQDQTNIVDTIRNILQNSANGGGSLDSFSIRNARVAFRDEPTGLFVVSPDTTFTLKTQGKLLAVSLDSVVEISGLSARFAARAVLRENGTPDHGTIDVKGLSFPALASNSAKFAVLKPYALISDGAASFSLDEAGGLIASDFHLSAKGSIQTALLKTPLRVSKLDAAGRYDVAQKKLTLDAVSFDTRQISAKAKANVDFVWKDGELEALAADVDAKDVGIDIADWFLQPVAFPTVAVHALYEPKSRKISWEHLSIKGGALTAELSGGVQLADSGAPAVKVSGTLEALPIGEVLKYWPVGVAEGARSWIVTNVPDVRLGPVRLDADLPAGALDASALPDSALTVSFPFQGGTAHYLRGMTPITGARGEGKLTGDMFHLAVSSGSVGPLVVSDGDVTIPDLHTIGAQTSIKAHVEGTMVQVLQLIDEEPLGYAKRFGIDPPTVAGIASVDLDFSLPLLRDLKLDQVQIGVQAKATELGLPIEGRKLEHAAISFAIDTKSLTAQGAGNFNAVPVSFKWTEDFQAPGITTRVDLAGRLDDSARASLSLSEPKWITGTMPVTLSLAGRRFHFESAALKADLTNAAAEIPALNLAKRTGTPGNATAQLRFGEAGAMALNDLVVTSPNLNVRGDISFDREGKLANASLASLRSGVNDVAMNIQPIAGGGLSFAIQGKSLDASHFFGKDKKKAPNAAARDADSDVEIPLSIEAKVDRLVLHDDVGLRNVSLTLGLAPPNKLTAFGLDAVGIGKGKITGRMTVVNGVRNLALDTDDAGAFIQTFTGFSSIRNGKLSARITFPGNAPGSANQKTPPPDYQGLVTLSDIVVTDQPFVARLFSAGSLDGPLRLLQGDGIPLSSASVPFTARGPMIMIREGRTSGGAIGATFEGTVDRKSERVDVAGTLVPVYGLNNILGSVPLLGDILISKKGEGIFGLTYAMKGNLNEPTLSVNPLSVLTPGIFRRIFEFRTPKEQPQVSADPPPKAEAPKTQ
jgi:hypothetical protein